MLAIMIVMMKKIVMTVIICNDDSNGSVDKVVRIQDLSLGRGHSILKSLVHAHRPVRRGRNSR